MFILSMETDLDQQCPFWFTKTDSKQFCNYAYFEHLWQTGNDPDVIGMLKEHFGLDLDPILKVSSEDMSLEDWLMEGFGDEAEWRRQMEINQAAWQPPQTLITSLRAFLNALDSEPDVFDKLNISEPYFVKGAFKQDLRDLLRMAEWAQEAGARRVRLVLG